MQNSIQGFRLSAQQRHLWRLQETTPEQPYRAVCAILLEGDLQPRILEKSLYDVVHRHEILRTTFQRPPGIKTPFQVVSENAHLAWQAIDLTHLDAAHQEHRVEASMAEERARRFDFERGPLLRVSVFRLSQHRRVMTVSLPALCADRATLSHFTKELSQAYQSNLQEREEACEVMQYADFADWQNELLESGDDNAIRGKAYWRQSANADVPFLQLEKRAERGPYSPAVVPMRLNPRMRQDLEAMAQHHAVSLDVALFAAWQALMWRLTGRSDLVLFKLCDGRRLDDLKGALGLYDSYVPVTCHSEDVPLSKILSTARDKMQEVDVWLNHFEPDSIAGQIGFEFTAHAEEFLGNGLRFSIYRQQVVHQPFKLKLHCKYDREGLLAELEYDEQLFERTSVERFAGYWGRSLSTSVETRARLGSIDIIADEERRQLIVDLNETEAPFSRTKCVHELFEEQVARTPDATALVYEDFELTYAQLNARANQLAHVIREQGVKTGDRVGLSLERGAEVIIGLLGILKAGAAYVPLNPDHPQERLAYQIAESNAALLITNTGHVETNTFDVKTIDFEFNRDLLAAAAQNNQTANATPDDLVYVIYTSGSTGLSKGVAVQHRNLVNYAEFVMRLLQIREPLHFATVSTITADLGNTCIFPALLSGGCLHVLSYEMAMEGERMRGYVSKRPIDVLKIVPSHLQALLAAEPEGEFLPSRFLLLGGEALSWELAERLTQLRPRCQIYNHYGPTETTVGSLTFRISGKDRLNSLTVPIGRPITNTCAYVLDEYMHPVPTGVAGELYLGGAGVTMGYLNQPAETAARFIADPFAGDASARLYRTGDMVRRLSEGSIEFIGRTDNQIKVRGFRVELGEIEAALAAHPGVTLAVVLGSNPSPVSQRLVAYFVAAASKPPTSDDLRSFLRQRLPDYMVPSVFVCLREMPLTANGKIDRAALPAPEDTRPELQRIFVAPRNDTEKELAGIWARLLKIDEVGVHDNFFDLGGHSLLATQVVSRMRQVFKTEIPLRSLFEAPTVSALAERIDATRFDDTARLVAELEQLSDEEAMEELSRRTADTQTRGSRI